jgi:hypothetical protein
MKPRSGAVPDGMESRDCSSTGTWLKTLGQRNRRQRVIGWASVVLVALVASFFAALAGWELPRDPPQMMAFHLVEIPVLLGLAAADLHWPRAIGVIIALGGPLGLAIPLFFFSTVEHQSLPHKLAALAETWPIIGVTATTGVLLLFGRPKPVHLVYGMVIGTPLGVFAISALLTTIVPPYIV